MHGLSSTPIELDVSAFRHCFGRDYLRRVEKVEKIKKEKPFSVEMIKNYFEYETRNQWVDWNGNTSVVDNIYYVPYYQLDHICRSIEKRRLQGSKFKIIESPALIVRSRQNNFLVLSSNSWNIKISENQILKFSSLEEIEVFFEKSCAHHNLRDHSFSYYVTKNHYSEFISNEPVFVYDSYPSKPVLKWFKTENESPSVENHFKLYKLLKSSIYNKYNSSSYLKEWVDVPPNLKKNKDDYYDFLEARLIAESKRSGNYKSISSKSNNVSRVNYWLEWLVGDEFKDYQVSVAKYRKKPIAVGKNFIRY